MSIIAYSPLAVLMEATIPYVDRDSNGEIVCLYGTVSPMFAQARTYLSTGKLQERLDEYPAVHEEAARLGVTFDEAVGHADDIHDPDRRWTICGRWPEWIDDAELTTKDPAAGGVFDSGPVLEDIREAYEESHESGAGDVGGVELSDPDLGGDAGELEEAGADALAGDGGDDSHDPLGDDSGAGGAGAYPGVMVTGDPLKAAKNDAREALAQMQRSILDRYPWQDNLRDFDQMQSVRWAIAEGTHPPFTDEQQAEFDALSTFSNWFGRVNQNAFNITVQIDDAQTVEDVNAIDINAGWPE